MAHAALHRWLVIAAVLATTAALACSAPAVSGPATPPAAADAPTETAVPHGDHNPHFGGLVFMHGELHFEVVLARDGTHRVYFSDATRADLPAATATSVTITVSRSAQPDEVLTASIDDSGESWMAHGQPIEQEVSARVAFLTASGSYWIDIPYSPPAS